MINIKFKYSIENFSLSDTLECGQCFRFFKNEDDSYLIFAGSSSAIARQDGDTLFIESSTADEVFWENYFDLATDYAPFLKGFDGDHVLENARKSSSGIRILRQDPFEALISFIISANNNIPRIKGIISRLCEHFGEPIKHGFSFPTIERLALCTKEDLDPIRAGFRAKYIVDATQKISSGEVSIDEVESANLELGREILMKICGVGVKVSDCTLLFGFHKLDAFPVDVWMKRVQEMYYPKGLTSQVLSCPGFAQQLLFNSIRKGVDLNI